MTIHHDKLAYGKLASMHEDFSEESLMQMVQALSEKADVEENCTEKQENQFVSTDKQNKNQKGE